MLQSFLYNSMTVRPLPPCLPQSMMDERAERARGEGTSFPPPRKLLLSRPMITEACTKIKN